jgi:integrase
LFITPALAQQKFSTRQIQKLKKKQLEKVRKISGVYFNLHDLRRTFITIAESLDINTYALKKLLNHKDQRDVTGGYIITDMERLREPMNKITDHILEQVK